MTSIEPTPKVDTPDSTPRYLRPGALVTRVLNPMIMFFAERGRGPAKTWVLEVPGRKSGQPKTVPVNPLKHEGATYLVAGRGETEWVRNLRAADGGGVLRRGRTTNHFAATEVTGEEKAPILKAYLRENATTVKAYFDISPDAPVKEFSKIANKHPVFRIGDSTASAT